MSTDNCEETNTTPENDSGMDRIPPRPVLLIAYSPADDESAVDRCEIAGQLTVGRKPPADFQVYEGWLSKVHFRMSSHDEEFFIEDLNSTNGTFVNGLPLLGQQRLKDTALIRAGRTLFVFHADGGHLLEPNPMFTYNMAGRFHVAPLLSKLSRIADAYSHVIITGPTGSGKELAAHALAKMARREIVIHNAARFGTEDELVSTLFGVGAGIFTGVDDRVGLIERADRKMLFLDEAHHLPLRIPKSLLRVVEDWQVARIGETEGKRVDVRFILASNDPSPSYGFEHDLLARFRVVKIPPLSERVADIPDIYRYLMINMLKDLDCEADDVMKHINADHYESLCLDGFPKDNARGLLKLAGDMVDEIRDGIPPERAVKTVFESRYKNGPVAVRNSLDTNVDTDINIDNDTDTSTDTGTDTEVDTCSTPQTCADLVWDCGKGQDACGNELTCSSCDDGEWCEDHTCSVCNIPDHCGDDCVVCEGETPFCSEGNCVQCLEIADCEVLHVCRNHACTYAVHSVGEEASYEGEGLLETTRVYFLQIPPLEHDAMLVSFNFEISRTQTPYFVGYFALYESHPVDELPFGDAIIQGETFNFASFEVAEAPLQSTTLQEGNVYWVAVDIGEDSSERTSNVYPTATVDDQGVTARPYYFISNSEIDLSQGITTIDLNNILELSSVSSSNPTDVFPSFHIVVQDLE